MKLIHPRFYMWTLKELRIFLPLFFIVIVVIFAISDGQSQPSLIEKGLWALIASCALFALWVLAEIARNITAMLIRVYVDLNIPRLSMPTFYTKSELKTF